MTETTSHGDNIASDIHEDAYGQFDILTTADLWNILDNLHTHYLDNPGEKHKEIMNMITKWLTELEEFDDSLPL